MDDALVEVAQADIDAGQRLLDRQHDMLRRQGAKVADATVKPDGMIVQALAQARLAGVKEGLEMASAYVDGQGGVIPGANVFAALVTGNNQPCMSGDARDRMQAHRRRQFDDATLALSSAIRSLGPRP